MVSNTSRRTFTTSIAGFALFGPLLHVGSAYAGAPEVVTIRTPSGRSVSAHLSVPGTAPAPAVVLIHGGYGLTDFYRTLPSAYAEQGFVALAVDLFDGAIATTLAEAQELTAVAQSEYKRTTEILVAWIDWLRADPRTTKKVAAVGWSFGAQWALISSSVARLDAAVLYYGGTGIVGIDLKSLKTPFLGHFAERDTDPHPISVKYLAKKIGETGESFDLRWYPADHSFANPTLPGYDKTAAEASWQATLAFLHANLD
jgi:carboxymethylenebutenolidase